MKTVHAKNRAEWRKWLTANHKRVTEVWLIYYKKETGKTSIAYGASVEEALCFGWVDSLIKNLDDTKYARKFTPRKSESRWSRSNKKRVEKLIAEGLMTEHGLRLVEAAKRNGNWDGPEQKLKLTFEITPEFAEALAKNRQAKETFDKLAASYQKQYLGWIEVAKGIENRQRRIAESIQLLEAGKKLGLR